MTLSSSRFISPSLFKKYSVCAARFLGEERSVFVIASTAGADSDKNEGLSGAWGEVPGADPDRDPRSRHSGVTSLRVPSDRTPTLSNFYSRRGEPRPLEPSRASFLGSSSRRLVRWLSAANEGATPYVPAENSEWRGAFSVLAAVDELSTYSDVEEMLRRAAEIAVERFGLQRVALYVSDPPAGRRHVLRGTWSAGANQELADERGLYLEMTEADYALLRGLRGDGPRWLHAERVGTADWQVVTPLLSGEELVGVLFNDGGTANLPMDEGRQVQTLLFCSLLAGLILPRRGAAVWHALRGAAGHSPVVHRVLEALGEQPKVSAQRLARDLGISSGHLARLFRTEMGISLVEYRNRLRIERFLSLADRSGGNLLDAALEAGFGSYAQFHRVFRKLVGTTPREYVAGVRIPSSLPDRRSRRPVASE
jgi:AraC-like DNA-binding protein